ncbi:MAG: glycosyltransferase family 39 protein, partial [Candidatus Omnitrophica bacterium]|nr:glycosyltransferase family 39 protein [Candidatus Omnitrophota bacterium]
MNNHQKLWIWTLVLALVVLGVMLRVRVSADLPLDADESIAGLMARNIAYEGEAPLFLYGESYVGSAMQFVVAGMFRLFGFHPQFIRWPEYLWSGLFLLLGFLIARRTDSTESGLWTLLLLALPPIFLSIINLKSWGDYNETFCLGGLLWLLSLKLCDEDHGSLKNLFPLFVWGLAFGLGFWIHFPILIYAIPSGLWLLWYGFRSLFPWRWGILLLGFLIGWAPALYYNLTNGWANLGYAAKGGWDYLTRLEMSGKMLIRMVEQGMPFLLGVQDDSARFIEFDQFDPMFAKVAIVGGVLFALGLHLYRNEGL